MVNLVFENVIIADSKYVYCSLSTYKYIPFHAGYDVIWHAIIVKSYWAFLMIFFMTISAHISIIIYCIQQQSHHIVLVVDIIVCV